MPRKIAMGVIDIACLSVVACFWRAQYAYCVRREGCKPLYALPIGVRGPC
jgi:hypothetical protein